VKYSADPNDSYQPTCNSDMWFSEDKKQSDNHEWNHVFQVIEMRPPNPVNGLVGFNFETFNEDTILWI
jgi:hypothetical protein